MCAAYVAVCECAFACAPSCHLMSFFARYSFMIRQIILIPVSYINACKFSMLMFSLPLPSLLLLLFLMLLLSLPLLLLFSFYFTFSLRLFVVVTLFFSSCSFSMAVYFFATLHFICLYVCRVFYYENYTHKYL